MIIVVPCPHLESVCLGIHVSDVDSSFVAEQELFTLTIGVDAHVVLVTLFVGNKRLHDKGVEDASYNLHLKQARQQEFWRECCFMVTSSCDDTRHAECGHDTEDILRTFGVYNSSTPTAVAAWA